MLGEGSLDSGGSDVGGGIRFRISFMVADTEARVRNQRIKSNTPPSNPTTKNTVKTNSIFVFLNVAVDKEASALNAIERRKIAKLR